MTQTTFPQLVLWQVSISSLFVLLSVFEEDPTEKNSLSCISIDLLGRHELETLEGNLEDALSTRILFCPNCPFQETN